MTQHSDSSTLYEQIGGAEKLRELVDRFYDLMSLEADFNGILKLHPTPLSGSRDKLFWFLSGWMGGPDLYIEQFGHPRLRARHLPYQIGISERNQWLICMCTAMQDMQIEEKLRDRLLQSFYETADWMRNREG
ncbi:group II truncated hemoglobin [Solimicrobium silvestre]|uniref:Truncated hemoglobin n=1 Tax=Solimicrobium silvestre TaxID=2099400 RepID=A0A2S9GZN0_9BURK|nr:group II truncated hemoglobin [Solimicrobium silvestre]PRC93167.1 Truncated hemoglobin [Solimicrobium silvestre]